MESTPYDALIVQNPKDGEAYFQRALYFFEEVQDYEQAKEDFIQAINLEHNLADAYSNLALIYDMQEDHQAALECLQKSVNIDENHSMSWFALGTLHSIYGRHEEALSALAKVLEIELDYDEDHDFLEEDLSFAMEAFTLRTRIYLEMNENELALAEAQASKAFDSDSNECELLEVVALLRLKQEKEAKAALAHVLESADLDRQELKEHPLFKELTPLL